MKALRFYAPDDLRLEDVPEPECGPDEVKMRVRNCSTCGTEVNNSKNMNQNITFIIKTVVAGAREIVEVGAEVNASYGTQWQVGDRVQVIARIMLGTFALSSGYYDAYYRKAQQVRTLITRDFEQAFQSVDIVLSATSPVLPWRLDEKLDDPLAMYLMDVLTLPCSLAGLPGLSMPSGVSASGLPIGVQLLGRRFDEATLLRTAFAPEAR